MKLFRPEEDVLDFLEDYGLDEARAALLEELGRIAEAADIHARNGDTLKAVEMLIAPADHNTDHERLAVEFLLTGLRKRFTLEVLPTPNPAVSGLLRLAGRLNRSVITEQEADEVSPYQLPSIQLAGCLPLGL